MSICICINNCVNFHCYRKVLCCCVVGLCVHTQWVKKLHHFTALASWMECIRGLASVRLSVKCVDCDKTEERSVQISTPYERSFSPVFWEEEWLVGATTSPEILDQPAPVGAKSPILNRYSLVAPQPYDLAKNVQLTLIGSPLRSFQRA